MPLHLTYHALHLSPRIYRWLLDANITGAKVYKRENMPKMYHYQASYLIPDIVVIADKGYVVNWGKDDYHGCCAGNHGWYAHQSSDMWGIMLGRGPAFKRGYIKPGPIRMVDHYQLLTSILGVKPRPHNGTWSNVADLLALKRDANL